MKRILISRSNDLLRVARTDGQSLYDLEIEHANITQNIDSICNAEIVSIEPSLNAAFANFGSKRNGFLPLKEIAPEYFQNKDKSGGRPNIKDALFTGQKILVQINKEERGTKGAALSTYITLAGCYLVLMPNNPQAGGISRRIEGEEREELKSILNSLNIPKGMGVIVRTAGIGKNTEELQWDLDVLIKLWESIKAASKQHGAPVLIHKERDIATRAVRDHLREDISEILIDDEEIFKKVYNYIERVRPDFIDRLKLYADKLPLFSRFQLEKQIESAYQRKIRLPSGGEIVIDRTEALIAIDVNSAQATKGGDIEETALNTNLEAADEIAKQLRIRDLAGLIVIDFIDMDKESNNHKVEERMREALRSDRARVQLARLSRFGLLEMSRQRLRPTLSEASLIVCPRCHGQGSIRNIQSQAQSILHLLEESAQKKNINQIRVQLPIELATFMLNELRHSINLVESSSNISIIVIANPFLETPQYEIECLNVSGAKTSEEKMLSYEMLSKPSIEYTTDTAEVPAQEKRVAAVVDEVFPEIPAPRKTEQPKKKKDGWLKGLLNRLTGADKENKKTAPRRNSRHSGSQERNSGDRQGSPRQNRDNYRHTRRPGGRSRTQGDTRRRDSQSSTRDGGGDSRRNSRPNTRGEGNNTKQDTRPNTRREENDTRQDARPNPREEGSNTKEDARPNTRRESSDTRRDSRPNTRRESGNTRRDSRQRPRKSSSNENSRSPSEQKPIEAPIIKSEVAIQPKPKKPPVFENKIEPTIKPAPRYKHTPTKSTPENGGFQQMETTQHTANIIHHDQHKPVNRGRKINPKATKNQPEEFVMIETKTEK